MKKEKVWMPMLAFLFAIGAAFATTPINAFQTEVWTKQNPSAPCVSSDCMLTGVIPCPEGSLYYSEATCINELEQAFRP